MNIKLVPLLAAGIGLMWAHSANAATCNVNDVKFGVSPSAEAPADSCSGPTVGNDSWSNPNDGSLTNFDGSDADLVGDGGTWYSLAKWDSPSTFTSGNALTISTLIGSTPTNIGTIQFSLASQGIVSGYNTFDLKWTYNFGSSYQNYIPIIMDLNIVTKQSSGYAQYFFEKESLTATNQQGFGNGSFRISYQCSGGPNGSCVDESPSTGFSHLSVYGRNIFADENIPDEDIKLPEPDSIALVGIGILGMGLSLRKRYKA